ncbi:dixin isoform X4 [Rhineura floridana]|uniref:dixin isoform X4 n=1 Tax=Rhineura floridana TaxID=261503 RepID=UPI002AC82462|nr:dixin isoform X4 [Rhineura floridana]
MLACLAQGNLLDILHEGFTEQQLQAYVAWVNSQLKKKPAVKPVQDLRQDLRDGVILASLIEIVAGEKLNGVEVSPTSPQEMRENVEKVLQFVASKKIRMHQTSAKDIVDGNLKCIMRLILALAAHFKPGSSKVANQAPSSTMGKRSTGTRMSSANHRPHSAAAVAQGAVAALADVRHDVSRLGRDVFRHRRRDSSLGEETEHPYWSVRALVQQYEEQQSVPSESHSSSLASPSPVNSARSESSVTPSEEKAGFEIVREEEADTRTEETGSPFPPESQQARCPATGLEISWEEQLLEQQDHLEKEMEEAKKMISGLQALLLNGSLPEDEQERSFVLCEQDACPGEQLIIVRSRLDQSIEENQELKKELQRHKQEARSLQGIKPWLMFASFLLRGWHRWRLGDVDALQQRLAQQDALILQIKQELLRAKMDKEELHSQNVDLQRKVEERNRLLVEYKCEPPSPADDPNSHCVAEGTGPEGPALTPTPGQDGGNAAAALRGQLSAGRARTRAAAQRSPAGGSVYEEGCGRGDSLQQSWLSEQWLPADIRERSHFHSAQRDQRLAAGARGSAQLAEQFQRPRPPAPHHRQPGAGHLQPDGEAAPHGDAQEAGEEGPREITCQPHHERLPRALALQLQTASFSQHPCNEQQCMHQSALLHRPLPHTFHGQHTKEVR